MDACVRVLLLLFIRIISMESLDKVFSLDMYIISGLRIYLWEVFKEIMLYFFLWF